MTRIPTLPLYRSNKVYRRVPYNQIKPVSDGLAYYKGRLYGTKEDLKYFPKNVRLVKFLGEK